jgi:hypothetical protein
MRNDLELGDYESEILSIYTVVTIGRKIIWLRSACFAYCLN